MAILFDSGGCLAGLCGNGLQLSQSAQQDLRALLTSLISGGRIQGHQGKGSQHTATV